MASDQQKRRHDPYPWTWEIPVAIILTVLLALTVGVHLGRAIANLAAGAGWHVAARSDLFTSLPRILSGDAAAGLTAGVGPVASAAAMGAWIVAVDLIIATMIIIAARFVLGRWGPGRMKGMANRSEAAHLLGPSRLRRNAATIRPDLYR